MFPVDPTSPPVHDEHIKTKHSMPSFDFCQNKQKNEASRYLPCPIKDFFLVCLRLPFATGQRPETPFPSFSSDHILDNREHLLHFKLISVFTSQKIAFIFDTINSQQFSISHHEDPLSQWGIRFRAWLRFDFSNGMVCDVGSGGARASPVLCDFKDAETEEMGERRNEFKFPRIWIMCWEKCAISLPSHEGIAIFWKVAS
ncbi:unnamed protein product [Lactuca virosa]|uniref:Uncharacterized protein n=1 Tax=Lactuca virosa TaxID=75947 RepID=A0AAU9NMC7_9ASTR|nr:unnamed protein product [Lactuca virosa]